MGRNLAILAAAVTALAFGLTGVAFAGESVPQPLQLAKADNGSRPGVAQKASRKK